MPTRSVNRVVLIASGLFLVAAGCRSGERAGPRTIAETPTRPPGDPMTSVDTLVPAPADYARQRVGTADYPLPLYAKFLKGLKIRLDPGHGGDAEKRAFKRGPTGVREAEVNLRVAQHLRDLLSAAGAEVTLSRESDVDLSYEERAGAHLPPDQWPDLFISCHHNAIDNKPSANHTTVWYHADVDYRPSNLDLARYLCLGLYEHLPMGQITDQPLKSDQLMYPEGFAVLRHAKVTAALVETSFYTNPDEEQRLRQPEYNLREAYALFMGLAHCAAAGLPRAKLIRPADATITPTTSRTLEFQLDDGLRDRKSWGSERQMILTSSIDVRFDGTPIDFQFSAATYRLTLEVPANLTDGEHRVDVQFQNLFKNSVINPSTSVTVRTVGLVFP